MRNKQSFIDTCILNERRAPNGSPAWGADGPRLHRQKGTSHATIDRSRGSFFRQGVLVALILLVVPIATMADSLRVLPEGKQPQDRRLGDLKTLDGYFPFHPCKTKQEWAKRSERVRRQLLVATGLWPMPTKTPARAVIHGRVDRDKYTVEKVYLESFPGHFVTGSLYRPKGRTGRLPGVISPHGHWSNGRFYDAGEKSVRESIVQGAERFEVGGRHPIQSRCVQLARMGCVVFQWDMVGYADSIQIVHRPGERKSMNTLSDWGYFSMQAELHQQNMMGLQTYNATRVLDWFSKLSDVDPNRIGVTGASGGGTQTFMLCALDPRPAVAFPAVMVSTAMQGGCTCENACYLRIGTSNVEIAALIGPRPLGLTAANDWTKEIATKGLPELKQHYKMLGVPDRVMAKPMTWFPHNYNYVSRAVMYSWMNRYLKLGAKDPIVEEDYQPLSPEEGSVWDANHPKPPQGDDYERSLLRWITKDSEQQMAALLPHDAKSLAKFRHTVGGAIDIMIGRSVPQPGQVKCEVRKELSQGDYQITKGLLRYQATGEELPTLILRPTQWNKHVVLWITPTGKQALFGPQGKPIGPVAKLLSSGVAVVGVDLYGQGEFTPDGKPIAKTRLVKKGYAGYTFGYNYPVFSKRVHDILSVVSFVRGKPFAAKHVSIVGLRGAGHWVAAARAQAGGLIEKAAVDTAGFRFAQVDAIDAPDFLPGGAKYNDLPGMLALSAPYPLWVAGEGDSPSKVLKAAYVASGKTVALKTYAGKEAGKTEAALKWILQDE